MVNIRNKSRLLGSKTAVRLWCEILAHLDFDRESIDDEVCSV
jgi:hypothetical protein